MCRLGLAMTDAGRRLKVVGYAGASQDVLQSCLGSRAGCVLAKGVPHRPSARGTDIRYHCRRRVVRGGCHVLRLRSEATPDQLSTTARDTLRQPLAADDAWFPAGASVTGFEVLTGWVFAGSRTARWIASVS